MHKFLSMLLPLSLALAAGPAGAVTYKCVSKGGTTYSQEPCGANAQQVNTTDALSGVGVPTPVPAGTPSTPTAPAAPATPATPAAKPSANSDDKADDNSCAARIKAYQESLACFAPYRHSANVIDVEAYKHCKVVSEPTDCE